MRFRVRIRRRWLAVSVFLPIAMAAVAGYVWFHDRYDVSDETRPALREFTNAEYPEDPATRSTHFGNYSGRTLRLVRRDKTRFDFVFEPADPHVARVVFRDIDASLMTPGEPSWTKDDPDLERIALVDRQWNRQQVSFDCESPHLELEGGDGFESENLVSAELAKNCLNAGLWEVLLFVRENGRKALYYHAWFTFPLGHYAKLFEHNTGVSYWKHWYKLEHWSDPVGTPARLEGLRQIECEREVPAKFDPGEPVFVVGEQINKRRTTVAVDVRTWGDWFDGRPVWFAAFVPPGRYNLNKPWKQQFHRLAKLERAVLRKVISPARSRHLQELELVFADSDHGAESRFVVSGFDLADLPQLSVDRYPEGLYMPMGIGVPPFFQSYTQLEANPPDESPYFCLLLDSTGHWINHHEVAVDGPILHRDVADPERLHVYLLSYERHTLLTHFVIDTSSDVGGLQAAAAR